MATELLSVAGRRAPGAGGPVSELLPSTWKSRGPGGTGGDAGAEQKEAVVGNGVTGVFTPSENEMLWGRMRRQEREAAGHAGGCSAPRASHGSDSGDSQITPLRITGTHMWPEVGSGLPACGPCDSLSCMCSVPHHFCHSSPESPWHLGHPEVPWGVSGHWHPLGLGGCRWAEPPLS